MQYLLLTVAAATPPVITHSDTTTSDAFWILIGFLVILAVIFVMLSIIRHRIRYIIKLALVLVVSGFALINYRCFSFEKGISESLSENTWLKNIQAITSVTKIEYYNDPFSENYKVYIVTSDCAYLQNATEDDITALKVLGAVSKNYMPNKITPIPYYVDIIVALLIIVIPFGKKSTEQNNNP